MNVTFTRTGERRYRVAVDGQGVVPSFMEPAPGYDARLPHDLAHFVVEKELGIRGGIFGQLAAGGFSRTLDPSDKKRRKIAKRGKRMARANRADSMLSEQVVYLAGFAWKNDSGEVPIIEGLSKDDIRKVCREFDSVSAVWSKLQVGESMTLVWPAARTQGEKRRLLKLR